MSFFTSEQKKLALSCSRSSLNFGYLETENNLKQVAKTGNIKALKIAMAKHELYEYALLYTYTPEYIDTIKKTCSKRN